MVCSHHVWSMLPSSNPLGPHNYKLEREISALSAVTCAYYQTGEGAEPEGRVLNLTVNLYSNPHLWSWVVTKGGKRMVGRSGGRCKNVQTGLTSSQIVPQGVSRRSC